MLHVGHVDGDPRQAHMNWGVVRAEQMNIVALAVQVADPACYVDAVLKSDEKNSHARFSVYCFISGSFSP
jgi:hypothetical protein